MIYSTKYQDAYNQLMPQGFTFREVCALCQWQETYQQKGQQWQDVDLERRRLEFTHWLVATGRLTDYPHPQRNRDSTHGTQPDLKG